MVKSWDFFFTCNLQNFFPHILGYQENFLMWQHCYENYIYIKERIILTPGNKKIAKWITIKFAIHEKQY